MSTDRWLRNMEPLGCAPHIAFFGNGYKITDL
jgi:hypothetical protein